MSFSKIEGDENLKQFKRFRRYFNRHQEDEPRKVKMREFSESSPWQSVRDGTYLYVILPPTLDKKIRVRTSLVPLEILLDTAVSHVDLTLSEEKGIKYAETPLSAGLIRVLDEEIDSINLNSGHFKPGEGNVVHEKDALEATRTALVLCKAPLTAQTTFSTYRDRAESK